MTDDAYAILKKCLFAIKQGEYKESYQYFSDRLKNQVSLDNHVQNLKNIEKDIGYLRSYSSRPSIFKNYFLDEDLFKKNKQTKNQNEFRLLLKFERGNMALFAGLEDENGVFKICTFYLEYL